MPLKDALRTGRPVVSEIVTGRISSEPRVFIGAPVADIDGRISGVVYGALTLFAVSVLTFLTPMFGMLSGVLFLSERISAAFVAAALAVAAGIVLVNLRR